MKLEMFSTNISTCFCRGLMQVLTTNLKFRDNLQVRLMFSKSISLKQCKIYTIEHINFLTQRILFLDIHKHVYRRLRTASIILRTSNDNEFDNENSCSEESYIDNVTKRMYFHPGMGHKVLIIQPRVKYGPGSDKKSVSELKLDEAVSLVYTLDGWKVVEKIIVPVANLDSKSLFGSGNLEKLKMIIQKNPAITAVFIGIDILTSLQNTKLENYFNMQVFDRYQIILQIFHEHARTKEAKLQLALAEIPYLRIKLCSFSHTRDPFLGIHHVGGDGETFMEMRRRLLNERELKLKKELEKIKNQREFLRQSERRNTLPLIAVVGYTNCGKTTLIKSLTDDSRLLPEDKLFATLDVTVHSGLLPSNQKVLYVDTVGFISDVPTGLIQSFRSTLEEINLADLVIHIRDISHPDAETQKKTVLKTLEELNLPTALLESIIEVRNKVDLLEKPISSNEENAIYTSATEGIGLSNLLEIVEQKLFEVTDHDVSLLRIPNGGAEYSWLLKEAALRDAMADPKDENYLIVEVVISSANLAIFKHTFGDLTISLENLRYTQENCLSKELKELLSTFKNMEFFFSIFYGYINMNNEILTSQTLSDFEIIADKKIIPKK